MNADRYIGCVMILAGLALLLWPVPGCSTPQPPESWALTLPFGLVAVGTGLSYLVWGSQP